GRDGRGRDGGPGRTPRHYRRWTGGEGAPGWARTPAPGSMGRCLPSRMVLSLEPAVVAGKGLFPRAFTHKTRVPQQSLAGKWIFLHVSAWPPGSHNAVRQFII